MAPARPRVALRVTPRLFRDALSRALDPHVDVVLVPEEGNGFRAWAQEHGPFDLAIVSGAARLVDLDADLVVEIPVAEGHSPLGTLQSDGRTIRTLGELLELLPATA
jgi:hypothetical protein